MPSFEYSIFQIRAYDVILASSYHYLVLTIVQAWREITSRIEDAMRKLESQSLPNTSQMPKVEKEGESAAEMAVKLPDKTE